ncbi:MAG: hypothetical protein ACM3U1_11255 [Chloroflexota bacterium]
MRFLTLRNSKLTVSGGAALKPFRRLFLFCLILSLPYLYSCDNPFAPKLADGDASVGLLGDQKKPEDVFLNMRYAYQFKDTVVYGRLLADDFVYSFRNFDKGIDVTWGRDEEMLSTSRMFNGAQSLDLVWGEVFTSTGDSLSLEAARNFVLTITFNAADVVSVYGRVTMKLKKNVEAGGIWQIVSWRDESGY